MDNNKKEFIERVKLLTNYNLKKTLNENKEIIFEQVNVNDLVKSFMTSMNNLWQNNRTKGLINTLNQIPDNNTFIKFYNLLNSTAKKSFSSFINTQIDSDRGQDVLNAVKILKDKFGITIKETGVGATGTFVKTFRMPEVTDRVSWGLSPTTPPNPNNVKTGGEPKSDVIGYNADGSEIYGNKKTETTPPAPPTPAPPIAPQSFNDVINGKGILKYGAKLPAVGELQQKLIALGYTNIGRPTNYFGPITRAAVYDLQIKYKLNSKDGSVGPETSKKIEELLRSQQIATQRQQLNVAPSTVQRPQPSVGVSNVATPAVPGIQRR
jgi:hypothetical protein